MAKKNLIEMGGEIKMTELRWLIQMLTKQKLSSSMKDLFIERIGEVESNLVPKAHTGRASVNFGPVQAASTQKLLNEMELQTGSAVITGPIAQTTAAAQALESRQTAIKIANSGKPEPGRTSPRKF